MVTKNTITQFFLVGLIGLALGGIAYYTFYSFVRTWNFFADAEQNRNTGLALALFFQFGQNVILYLAAEARQKGSKFLEKAFYIFYAICCVIDAGTNLSERTRIGQAGNYDMVQWSLMYFVDTAIVFGEELCLDIGAIFLRELGKFIQYASGKDIAILRLIGDQRSSMGIERNVPSFSAGAQQNQRSNQQRDKQQNRPRLP